MADETQDRTVELKFGDDTRTFNVDDPVLPKWIDEAALQSGGYPYKKKLDEDEYSDDLKKLQIELVKVQFWQQATGRSRPPAPT